MMAGLVNYFTERVESDVFWRSPECYRRKQTWAGLHDMGCLPTAKGLSGDWKRGMVMMYSVFLSFVQLLYIFYLRNTH